MGHTCKVSGLCRKPGLSEKEKGTAKTAAPIYVNHKIFIQDFSIVF